MNQFLWKIGGEAGFGIMTTGLAFSKIAVRSGYHIFDYAEYPSLIRGGHNAYEVLITNQKVFASKKIIDLLVALNQETLELNRKRLSAKSLVIYDPDNFQAKGKFISIKVPFQKLLKQLGTTPITTNMIALGASTAIVGGNKKTLQTVIRQQFLHKQQTSDSNVAAATLGYNYIDKHYSGLKRNVLAQAKTDKKLLLTGNEAFALGSVVADCRLYAAYPMTPASNALSVLAKWQETTGMIVRHCEDEIAVINTALGSSFAGVRSSVGTSGGGFALMAEALSFAGIAEIPVVVYVAQRPGPATGMPTWTEQGDLLFAVQAGHGEFPKIVLAPGDIQEMLSLTTKAYDLADIYQTPVIVLADKYLSESHGSEDKKHLLKFIEQYRPRRGKTIVYSKTKPYLRYQINKDGISPRLIPGQKDVFYQANSYEHLQDGHTTENALSRVAQVKKRNAKKDTYLKNDFLPPFVYGDIKKAKTIFVSWGSNKGPILAAQKLLQQQKHDSAYIHFTHIYPLDERLVLPFFKHGGEYVLVENNSQAQFGKLLKSEVGINIDKKFLKYDGRPFWPEEIVKKISDDK